MSIRSLDSNYGYQENTIEHSSYSSFQRVKESLFHLATNIREGTQSLASRTVLLVKKSGRFIKTHAHHTWEYIQRRQIWQGLPIAVITSTACAFLFKLAHPLTGAAFGLINYVLIAGLIEGTRRFDDKYFIKAGLIVAISYVVTTALTNVVLRMPLPYLHAIPLAIAAALSHIVRRPDHNYSYGTCECSMT